MTRTREPRGRAAVDSADDIAELRKEGVRVKFAGGKRDE